MSLALALALALGFMLMFAARAVVKRRADNLDIVLEPAVAQFVETFVETRAETLPETLPETLAEAADSTDAIIVYLDAYRRQRQRSRAATYDGKSHSAS